ncbi:Hypothetical predicted protein [Lecanosticta acicola]|uniref:Uncharacterized protein n=1 Tax=Lecanosticta acicola TaxID=111012 RepID=A0AAI8Z5L4_9PEZI|nr:Hypothetical predicted protein [Lecanosticta acicola]
MSALVPRSPAETDYESQEDEDYEYVHQQPDGPSRRPPKRRRPARDHNPPNRTQKSGGAGALGAEHEEDEEDGLYSPIGFEDAFEALATSLRSIHLSEKREQETDGEIEQVKDATSARERVLMVVELLENILFHLPAATIRTVQSVRKRFKECYEGSKKLQMKTFQQVSGDLIAVPAPAAPAVQNDPPILGYDYNPLVLPYGADHMVLDGPYEGEGTFAGSFMKLHITFDEEVFEAHEHTGSWQRLHLADPNVPLIVKVAQYHQDVTPRSLNSWFYEGKVALKSCTIGDAMAMARGLWRFLRSRRSLKRSTDWVSIGAEDLDILRIRDSTRELMLAEARWTAEQYTNLRRTLN